MNSITQNVKRPALRYFGGKWRIAPWIISHFPSHRTYVEPFGGAASVLMRKDRSYGEVYNDLSAQIVNVFQILQDPVTAQELSRRIYLTPYARTEYESSRDFDNDSQDPIERARRVVVRSFMGFGSNSINHNKTGFRSNSSRSGTTPAHDWRNYPKSIEQYTERFRGVVIEQRDAKNVMESHDGPGTLHYVDPPYVHETRSIKGTDDLYEYEYDDRGHRDLIEFLSDLEGMVIISGYQCDLYDEVLSGWHQRDMSTRADRNGKRIESLWLNEAAADRTPQPTLFNTST